MPNPEAQFPNFEQFNQSPENQNPQGALMPEDEKKFLDQLAASNPEQTIAGLPEAPAQVEQSLPNYLPKSPEEALRLLPDKISIIRSNEMATPRQDSQAMSQAEASASSPEAPFTTPNTQSSELQSTNPLPLSTEHQTSRLGENPSPSEPVESDLNSAQQAINHLAEAIPNPQPEASQTNNSSEIKHSFEFPTDQEAA